MLVRAAGSLTIEKIRSKGLSWRDVFVEIPVALHNAPIAAALAAEIAPPSAATTLDYERWAWAWVWVWGHACLCIIIQVTHSLSVTLLPPPPLPAGSTWVWRRCWRRTWST